VRPEGLGKLKISSDLIGIRTATQSTTLSRNMDVLEISVDTLKR
jgi:hypothetical protein